MNVKWTDITLISAEPVDFPNSCLGIETPGLACMDVITPGYRIQLQAGRSVYTYVTNLEGKKVILAEGAGPSIKNHADVRPGRADLEPQWWDCRFLR